MDRHVLDNPVWSALNTLHANFAIGSDSAKRFRPDISPLAGALSNSREQFEQLSTLFRSGEELNILQAAPVTLSADVEQVSAGVVWQLVKSGNERIDRAELDISELGYQHRYAMLELAALTKPGPFAESSYLFGGFIGIFEKERLIAMAGERLRQPGYTEVSGVCTHPDYRGRGLARTLSAVVANRICLRNEVSYLHAYVDNSAAIGLYEGLGFKKRAKLNLVKAVAK